MNVCAVISCSAMTVLRSVIDGAAVLMTVLAARPALMVHRRRQRLVVYVPLSRHAQARLKRPGRGREKQERRSKAAEFEADVHGQLPQ